MQCSVRLHERWFREMMRYGKEPMMRTILYVAVAVAGLALMARAADKETTMKLTSTAFEANQPIPSKYTGEGPDVSPALKWEGAPAGTKSFALICDDPDALSVAGRIWVHWVLYGIPANVTSLPENVAKTETVAALGGAKQGLTDFGKVGYGGPMPPRGHGIHHYHFKLYALDGKVNLKPGATKSALETAMKGHIVGQAELMGKFKR